MENDWLAAEAAMAANQTMSYRGVTPAMSVFGILPREGLQLQQGEGVAQEERDQHPGGDRSTCHCLEALDGD